MKPGDKVQNVSDGKTFLVVCVVFGAVFFVDEAGGNFDEELEIVEAWLAEGVCRRVSQ